MAINPLTKRPQPPGGVPHRAMFFWSGAVGSTDPLDTDSAVNSLISFLDELNVGCNTIFLDIWRYLGGSNWTNALRDRLYAVLDGLKRSGCRVYALAGNVDWGVKHKWVMDNIVEPVLAFNAIATSPSQQFDGIMLDVEYWTDATNFPVSTNCPGLCDLVKAIKARAPQLSVGLFLAFFLKDNTATRATLTYAGKTAQDGEHFMDVVDFIFVAGRCAPVGDREAQQLQHLVVAGKACGGMHVVFDELLVVQLHEQPRHVETGCGLFDRAVIQGLHLHRG
jgi:hypothetical protein